VDQHRFEELKAKAAAEAGLSRAEADELGRLYAEEAGAPYSNADDAAPEDDEGPPGIDAEALRREEESGTLEDRSREARTLRPATPASLGEIQAEDGLQHDEERRDEEGLSSDRPG
jgi:hypothetical protein